MFLVYYFTLFLQNLCPFHFGAIQNNTACFIFQLETIKFILLKVNVCLLFVTELNSDQLW